MNAFSVPTSKDIYLEINGKKLAVVESYKTSASKESKPIEAFGAEEPVASIGGKIAYHLELSRVYVIPGYDDTEVDFYTLSDFNLVIVKPDRKIVYTGCQWAAIDEHATLHDCVIEKVRVVASARQVVA